MLYRRTENCFVEYSLEKRPAFLTQQWSLFKDNAQLHTPQVTISASANIGTLVKHPPYNADLTISDLCTFSAL